DDGTRGAGVRTGGRGAVLADAAHHEPAAGPTPAEQRLQGHFLLRGLRLAELLDELHMPPGCGRELLRMIVTVARPAETVRGELVPLLAGDLAGLAADADGGVGVEARGRSGLGSHAAAERPDEPSQEFRQRTARGAGAWGKPGRPRPFKGLRGPPPRAGRGRGGGGRGPGRAGSSRGRWGQGAAPAAAGFDLAGECLVLMHARVLLGD